MRRMNIIGESRPTPARMLSVAFDEGKRFGSGGVATQTSANRRGDSFRPRLFYPPHRQAEMLRFRYNQNPFRLNRPAQDIGGIGGQTFLSCGTAGKKINDARQL